MSMFKNESEQNQSGNGIVPMEEQAHSVAASTFESKEDEHISSEPSSEPIAETMVLPEGLFAQPEVDIFPVMLRPKELCNYEGPEFTDEQLAQFKETVLPSLQRLDPDQEESEGIWVSTLRPPFVPQEQDEDEETQEVEEETDEQLSRRVVVFVPKSVLQYATFYPSFEETEDREDGDDSIHVGAITFTIPSNMATLPVIGNDKRVKMYELNTSDDNVDDDDNNDDDDDDDDDAKDNEDNEKEPETDREIYYMSEFIHTTLTEFEFDDDSDVKVVDCLPVNTIQLVRFVDFLHHYVTVMPMNPIEKPIEFPKRIGDIVDKWYAGYIYSTDVQCYYTNLFELLAAADFMKIAPLFDLAAARIGRTIMNKTPDEVEYYYKLKKLTPDQSKMILDENKWSTNPVAREEMEPEPHTYMNEYLKLRGIQFTETNTLPEIDVSGPEDSDAATASGAAEEKEG